MVRRRRRDDEPPEGGWLGPPPTDGLKPLAVAVKADRKGRWIMKPVKQSREDRELREEWERRMAKADAKGKWRFKWPPKKKD